MKMNKSKIVVSTLAVCMGAALVGSVSGTVAWYQYSTKTTAAMMGTAAGVGRNLEIKIGSATTSTWKQELTTNDIAAWLATTENTHSKGDKLTPVTTGEIANNEALPNLKGNPIYGRGETEQWYNALDTAYVVLPLYIRAVERTIDGNTMKSTYVAKDIYLTDLTIQNKGDSGKEDITKAVRVHFSSEETYYALASLDGGDTDVSGKLDLNGDGKLDRVDEYAYNFQSVASGTDAELVYGDADAVATSFKATEKGVDKLLADDSDADDFVGGQQIAKTTTSENGILVNVTIYLEGWQKMSEQDEATDTIWDLAGYVGSQFYVGMTFSCESNGTN